MNDTDICILDAGNKRFRGSNESCLVELDSGQIEALLAPSTDWADRHTMWHDNLLERLAAIDATTRSLFSARSEVFGLLKLRMISFKGAEIASTPQYDTLSYTWHRSSWTVSPDLRSGEETGQSDSDTPSDGGGVLCPISHALWKILLHESRSAGNLFWVDQVCIDQNNEAEKNLSVTFTDRIYQNCQRTLIAMEDISVSEGLVDAVRSVAELHATEIEEVASSNPALFSSVLEFCCKIFTSRWSDRGWCSHEFFSSDLHIFFIPVEKNGGSKIRILRMGSSSLKNIALICARRLQSATDEQMNIFISYPKAMETLLRFASKVVRGSMPQTFFDCYRSAFRARTRLKRDQLVITLNTANSGLHYNGPDLNTEHECCRLVHYVALAAGDPSAIGVDGPALMHPNISPSSWLLAPTNDESRPGLLLMRQGQGPTSFKVEITESRNLHLYIIKLGNVQDVLHPDEDFLHVGSAFMGLDFRQIYSREPFGWESSLQSGVEEAWVRDEMTLRFVNQKYFYAQALALLLSSADSTFINLLRFNGRDTPSQLPEGEENRISTVLGWLRQQRGISHAIELERNMPTEVNQDSLRCIAKYLVQFVNTVLGVKGMYNPDESRSWESYKIGYLASSKLSTPKVPVVVPRFCKNGILAVPAAVAQTSYSLLRRLWILNPIMKPSEDMNEQASAQESSSTQESVACFELVYKTMLVGPQNVDPNERVWAEII